MASQTTMLADLINPQVLADFLNVKLIDKITLSPFADIDYTLTNRPGDTLTLPQWDYIGSAQDVPEGALIESVKLAQQTRTVTVKKIAKAVSLTDEAILSAYNKPLDEAVDQLAISLADKVDNDLFAAMRALTPVPNVDPTAEGYDWVLDAQIAMGENFDEETYLIISPKQRGAIIKASDFVYIQSGSVKITGYLGEIFGMKIVVSNRVADGEAFILKRGGLSLIMKRDVMVEPDRDVLHKITHITADQHYVGYVKDAKKAFYLKKAGA